MNKLERIIVVVFSEFPQYRIFMPRIIGELRKLPIEKQERILRNIKAVL